LQVKNNSKSSDTL